MSELRTNFWDSVPLDEMTPAEWEALCDGCGKCCLNKLEDADTGDVYFTRIACRLFDAKTCQCSNYVQRKLHVPECVVLDPGTLENVSYWLPASCAYKRLFQGKPLPDWHPLLTGSSQSVHRARASVQNRTLSETDIPEEDWEDHIIDEDI